MSPGTFAVPCPRCRQPSASIKSYRMPELIVFLFLFVFVRRAQYRACPSCMRMIVLKRIAVNCLTAHVAMFFIAPFYWVQFFRTFSQGHSSDIRAELQATTRR